MRSMLVVVLGFACGTPAKPPTAPAPPATPTPTAPAPAADTDRVPFDADARAAELAMLRDALRDGYAHLEVKRAQWGVDLDELFKRYEPLIRKADTWAAYEIVMVRFVAELHDDHITWRRKRAPTDAKRRVVRLGLGTRFVGEELIVSEIWPGSVAEQRGLRVGDRIVAIDGQTIEHRLGELASLRSWSRIEAARYDFADSWEAQRVAVDAPPRARRITREIVGGTYETLSVLPETTPRPGGRPPPIELVWRGDIAIFHVRNLGGHVKDTKQLADDIATKIFAKPNGLVVDLRSNEGGFEEGALAIAARLSARSLVAGTTRVRLSTRARATHKAWNNLREDPARAGWSVPAPLQASGRAPRDYPARVAVVIDAGCRSSCESLALLLRSMGARLYGERTGGAGGAPITVELPKSGARVGIPARASFDNDDKPIEGRGVAPDEIVVPTRADVTAKRDVALERAVDHVCQAGPTRC